MTERPARSTPAGAAYLDLRRLGRQSGRSTAELIQVYALEGLLLRLSRSPFRGRLVLKGGMLLAAFGTRRPTKDLDFLARGVPGDIAAIRELIEAVAQVEADDGLVFASAPGQATAIRTEDVYPGVRVTLSARLASARLNLHVDVNIGDPLWPGPADVLLPRLLDPAPLEVRGFPLHMVLAEKVVTAVQRSMANTRWRDFADVLALGRLRAVDGHDLQRAMREVAGYRGVELLALGRVLEGFAPLAQPRWAAWRRGQALEADLPLSFSEVLDAVTRFADPAIEGAVGGAVWSPQTARWGPHE